MEELLGVLMIFLFYGGGALLVAVIIIRSFFEKDRGDKKPFLKWLVVIVLSVMQVSCWNAMDGFNSAFGAGGKYGDVIFVFLFVTVLWLCYQVIAFSVRKPASGDPGSDSDE
jgi:uncharacterized membrane-anchored protein